VGKSYQEKSHGEETQTSEYNDSRPCGRIFRSAIYRAFLHASQAALVDSSSDRDAIHGQPAASLRGDRSDEQVMQALVTTGALVALADGRVKDIERYELLSYVDAQDLVPTIAQQEIVVAFDDRV
jgi:tellurite resistance protein